MNTTDFRPYDDLRRDLSTPGAVVKLTGPQMRGYEAAQRPVPAAGVDDVSSRIDAYTTLRAGAEAGDVVEVEWEDAYVEHGDYDAKEMHPALETTIGYLVRYDSPARRHPGLVLALTKHGEHIVDRTDKHYCDLHRIPLGMVSRVTVLRKGEAPPPG